MRKDVRREAALRELLDGAGRRYTVRWTDAGVPCAEFPFAPEPEAEPIVISAVLQEPILQIVAHRVLDVEPTEKELLRLNHFNTLWMLGRVSHDLAVPSCSISAGAYLGLGEHAGRAVKETLATVEQAARWFHQHWQRPGDSAGPMGAFLRTQWTGPQPVRPDLAMDALGRALAEAGASMRRSGAGGALRERFVEPGDHTFHLEIRLVNDRLLLVQAWPEGKPAEQPEAGLLRGLQDLNHHLPVGAVVFRQETGQVCWSLGLPLAWTTINLPLAHWLYHSAVRVTGRIETSLAGAG